MGILFYIIILWVFGLIKNNYYFTSFKAGSFILHYFSLVFGQIDDSHYFAPGATLIVGWHNVSIKAFYFTSHSIVCLTVCSGSQQRNHQISAFTSPEGRFNIKMSSYQYRNSQCGDKTILLPSYIHNGISYTDKTTSLYWMRAVIVALHKGPVMQKVCPCHDVIMIDVTMPFSLGLQPIQG